AAIGKHLPELRPRSLRTSKAMNNHYRCATFSPSVTLRGSKMTIVRQLFSILPVLGITISCSSSEPAASTNKPAASSSKPAASSSKPAAAPSKPAAAPSKPAALPAFTRHALTDIGYTIEAPSDWGFKTLAPGIYTFRIKPIKLAPGKSLAPSLTITKGPASAFPSTLETVGKRCAGTLLKTGTAKNSAIFHNCETETVGVKIFKAEYFFAGKESTLVCSASGLDVDTMNKACGSMRKK
ncbi:MAG: hypothetical protein ACI9U2_003462, partial [Bradymonadia bacterium]